METVRQKKIAALLAPIGLVAGMVVATLGMASSHMGGDRHYAVDSAGTMVTNTAGECWVTSGGVAGPQEVCGDEMPVEEVMVVATDVDSDGDGVPDSRDKCPGTRAGAEVDADGCEVVANLIIDLVEGEFEFDSAELKPGTQAALDDLAKQIEESRGYEVVTIVGHTDSTGPEDYNMGLSVRRAQSAADYLEAKGIADITVEGLGETQPIADNASRAGRSENRRIEIKTH